MENLGEKKIETVYTKLELAKYYISQGLGTNALNILNKLIADKAPETETERFHGLLGVANFLAGRKVASST